MSRRPGAPRFVTRSEIVEAPIAPRMSEGVLATSEKMTSEQAVSNGVPPAPPADKNWQQALDLSSMQERYPLLRNAL